MTPTPRTKAESYREIKASGEDVKLRKRVCAALAIEPDTTAGLAERFRERSSNAIQPRVTELVRMGCVERRGTKENASGASAYVHHVTEKGERYLDGEINPVPGDTVSERQADVVATARQVLLGAADNDDLFAAVENHDELKARMRPDFESRLVQTDGGEEQTEWQQMSDDERKRVRDDPVLTPEDYR